MYRRIIQIILATAVFAVAATPALAAKGGNTGSGSTITLVTLGSSAGTLSAQSASPKVGDNVTFDVQTAATDRPYILLNCYQGRNWIYGAQAFYSSTNPPIFTLSSSGWTSGTAECTARLGKLNADGTRFTDLASTTFSVSG
jgi:hypothetical protein